MHQLQLVEVALTSCLSKRVVPRLYSISLLLRTQGNFAKMCGRLQTLVERELVVKHIVAHGPPPQEAQTYQFEFTSYLLTHYKQFTRGGTSIPHQWLGDRDDSDVEVGIDGLVAPDQDGNRNLGKGTVAFIEKLKDFAKILNGCYWHSGVLEHYCRGPTCCVDRQACVQKMSGAILGVLLREVPLTPACSKWTKLGPCVDSVMCCLVVHGLFQRLFESLNVDEEQRTAEDPLEDTVYLQDVAYGSVQGKRFMAGRDMLRCLESRVSLIMLALVLEPLRLLSSWLMRRAREVHEPGVPPKSFDMWLPRRSPVCAVLQYLATLLWGRNDRLMFFWRSMECPSLHDWYHEHPHAVRRVRRAIVTTSCWVYRRFCVRLLFSRYAHVNTHPKVILVSLYIRVFRVV